MNPAPLETLTTRHNPLVDPGLHIWGWEIPVYLFLGGVVAGLMVLLAALEIVRRQRLTSPAAQWLPFIGIGLLSLGMGALFLDLSFKAHVYRFYLAFEPTSAMSWGSWILLLVYPALLLLGAGGLEPKWRRVAPRVFAFADRARRPVLWTTLMLGVGLGAYTGLLLGTMTARLQWNTGVLGPLFLTSGVSTGAALIMLLHLGEDEQRLITRWDTAAIAIELGLIATMLVSLSTSGAAPEAAAANLLGGPYTPWFWSLVVIGGLLVPLVMNLLELRGRSRAAVVAPILVLVGGFALRAVLVAAGQATSFRLLAG